MENRERDSSARYNEDIQNIDREEGRGKWKERRRIQVKQKEKSVHPPLPIFLTLLMRCSLLYMLSKSLLQSSWLVCGTPMLSQFTLKTFLPLEQDDMFFN